MFQRVLIIEDSRTAAFALGQELKAEGVDSLACHDLASGLACLDSESFDLVVLDLVLPDVVGLEGLAALKAKRPDLPVVILTGHNDAELAVEALKAGAQDYMIKGQFGQLLIRTLSFAIERNRVRRELEVVSAQKDRLLGMAAHDMRNPLTAIAGISELLVEQTIDGLSKEHHELLSHIESSSRFMLGLIDDLLDISAIESGHLTLRVDDVDLNDLARENVARQQFLAGPKSIELVLDLPAEPVVVQADARRLNQVLDNLISNAIKYSPHGTSTTVRVLRDADAARVLVIDQGPGIEPGEQVRLFEPFVRASSRATGGEGSTGLGLAIIKKIMEAHGGRVGLMSQPGQGSTFEISIPSGA